MEETQANHVDPFIVRESGWMNYLYSAIFFVIFIFAIITFNGAQQTSFAGVRYIIFISLIPAIYFLRSALKQNVIIEVNDSGIYYREKLITLWENFVNASYGQDEVVGSLNDNFRLLIQYYVPEKGMQYVMKIKMSASQDKSEDQIIEAIKERLDQLKIRATI